MPKNYFKLLLIVMIFSVLSTASFAQSLFKGNIISSNDNQPLGGASIVNKSSNVGIQSAANGGFSILAKSGDKLEITIIGFTTKVITVGKSMTALNILLDPADNALESIVVVGYATQKKVNLTGSVATISSKSIADRPVTNTSSSLAGLSAGVRVRQSSGRPGSDGASVQVRGLGTLSSSSLLVLIDGIQGSLDAVNPQDIDNISILKDASAAIYGSLAANGVILVTTKKGTKNKTTVNYSGMVSTTSPMNMPTFVTNYANHMRLINEGYTNVGQSPIFAPATINAWDSASKIPNSLNPMGVPNYIAYPNTNWSDYLFQNKLLQTHNISVNGGSDKTTYFFSVNYLKNNGVMDNTSNKRFQLRANLESKLNKVLTVGSQTFVSTDFYDKGNSDNAFLYLSQTTPGVYPYFEGKYGFAQAPEESATANNIRSYLYSTGGKDQTSRFNTTAYASLNLMKGLSFDTRFNYQASFDESSSFSVPLERWDFNKMELKSPLPSPSTLSTGYGFGKGYALVVDNVLRYSTTIAKKHDISMLAGYNERYSNSYNFSASKLGLIDYAVTVFNAATTPSSTSGSESDFSIRSWFGKVNYAFKNRYLLEGNLRYDGVSRFSPESRWGLFPSASAGWKISDEAFMKRYRTWMNTLKIRGSYGKLGNNASGLYDWQSFYGIQNYSFNNVQTSALAQTKISNPNLMWEATSIANIGLDGSFFGNKLVFEFDVYKKLTNGILTTVPVPLTIGTASAPVINAAAVETKGMEATIGYRANIRDVKFSISGNFAYNTNMVKTYKGKLTEGFVTDALGNKVYQSNLGQVSAGGTNRILEDHKINEYYVLDVYKGSGSYFNGDGTVNISGGPTDGMIRTADDLKWAQAMITAGYKLLPAGSISKAAIWYGDLIYADNNGDGLYGNSFDSRFTGTSSLPKYVFGFNTEISYKGFDLSMIWSGAAGLQLYYNANGYNNSFVRNGFALSNLTVDNRYYYNDANPTDPANRTGGKSVRIKSNDPQNNAVSTFWLYDGSYMKLKNLQLGYTIPANVCNRFLINRARLFLSGENLLMITKFPGLDAEIGTAITYPTMKQYALGLNITF